MTVDPFRTPAGQALAEHHSQIGDRSLLGWFSSPDAARDRVSAMTVEVADLVVDLSRHRATPETLQLLARLADARGLREATQAMLAGAHLNTSEDRAVLHTALRLPADASLVVDGQDVVADVHRVLAAMGGFADAVRQGRRRGARGDTFRTVVNLGIGGSDLGPAMVYRALRAWSPDGPEARFVSNVDPDHLTAALRDLDPATTLFVVVSKTFTTQETLANATTARQWLVDSLGPDAVPAHFVAVSTAVERARDFGVAPAEIFGFWDWVGGRFSVDSAVGLSLMLSLGPEVFDSMLDGMRRVDEHFASEPYERNAPALVGLLTVWYTQLFQTQSKAVVPYSQALELLPAFLQQLVMESNGKSVTADGHPVRWPTSPVLWGAAGTNGQHAFFQLLHQGTPLVPVDFLGFAEPQPGRDVGELHLDLLSNLLAQPTALAFGRSADELREAGVPEHLVAHRVMPGNRPSTLVLAPQLTPSVLGQLVALYEHAVLTEGVVWGINSFDQWGVELGKELARGLGPSLRGGADPEHLDAGTSAALRRVRAWRGLR